MQFKHILCVIPQLAEADSSTRAASSIARRHGSRLTCLHVIPAPDGWNVLFPHRRASLTAGRTPAVSQASERLVEIIAMSTNRDAAEFDVIVEAGPPETTVERKARELHCDLIVTAEWSFERILRHSSCPVMIARPEVEDGGILAASDLSDPAFPALAVAAEEAQATGTPLTALFNINASDLNAIGPGVEFGAYVYSQSEIDHMTQTARDQVLEALQTVGADAEVVVKHGAAAESILRTAAGLDSRLIVVGATERGLFSRLLFGSVSEAVAHRAHCSVLVIPLHQTSHQEAA